MIVADAMRHLLVPPRCLACGAILAPPRRRSGSTAPDPAAAVWCPPCRAEADQLRVEHGCRRCGLDREGGQAQADATSVRPHPGCWPRRTPVTTAAAPWRWTGVVADAVRAAKLGGAHRGWRDLGALLAQAVPSARAARADVVVAVPADPVRARGRDVDHAATLARAIADAHARPYLPVLVQRHGLADRGAGGASTALPDSAVAATRRLDGARVLLVDDIVTTGATAVASARALRRAGAREVRLVVLARAGSHDLAREPRPPANGRAAPG